MFYIVNHEEYEISSEQLESFAAAIGTYNALVEGFDASQIEVGWNIPTGTHYGVIADVRYFIDERNDTIVTFQVIMNQDYVLNCRVKANGLLSEWRRAYKRHFGTFQFGNGDEMVGVAVSIFATTTELRSNKNEYTTISKIRFISDEEINFLLEESNKSE